MQFIRRLARSTCQPHRVSTIPQRCFANETPVLLPTPPATKYVKFDKRMVLLGFGSIGEGVLPLILKHIDIRPENITIITKEDRAKEAKAAGKRYGIGAVKVIALTAENYMDTMEPQLSAGDFLINLTVDCSSPRMYELCHYRKALYLDTVVDEWSDRYMSSTVPLHERTNYFLREESLRLGRAYGPKSTTAVSCHGANPGMVSHFMKQGLVNMAIDSNIDFDEPTTKTEWGELARRLGVKVIHIAERDTQISNLPKAKGEFVNTWSVDGFVYEGAQPAELSWGSHEKVFPLDGGRHEFGSKAAIFLNSPGLDTQVRTWTPIEGAFRGLLVTHNESMSIGDYLCLKDDEGNTFYKPTVHYAYHPCNDAMLSVHELLGNNLEPQSNNRLMVDDLVSGIDELGVLFGGDNRTYWYGSQLEVNQCQSWIEKNSPTTLQVTANVMAGVVWAIENPRRGLVEAEQMDYKRILEISGPYLEPVVGVYTDWNPLVGRSMLFEEDVDWECPWQFDNIRCHKRSVLTDEVNAAVVPTKSYAD